MHTLLPLLRLCQDHLEKCGVDRAKREGEELVASALSIKRIDLFLQYDRPLQQEEVEKIRTYLKRRSKREPLAYIEGECSFYNCSLKLTPDVLIPRPETEQMVDLLVQWYKDSPSMRMLDLCTGSGCIGIALKSAMPQHRVCLSDLSSGALALARENAARNEVDVSCFEGDFLEPVSGHSFDLIVCNPPYVSSSEYPDLEPEVRDFEPKGALVAENGGLAFYERLIHELRKPWPSLMFEIGATQGPSVLALFAPHGEVSLLQDWTGRDRYIFFKNT